MAKEDQASDITTQKMIHEIPDVTLNKFNIELLTERLDAVTQWVQANDDIKHLSIGYFGHPLGLLCLLHQGDR